MQTVRKPDFIIGSFVAAVGVVYFINTFFIDITSAVVNPSTLPRIVGVGLIVLGVLLALSAVRPGRKLTGEAKTDPNPTSTTTNTRVDETTLAENGIAAETVHDTAESGQRKTIPSPPQARLVVLFFALFFVYLLILIPVGFILATCALLFAVTTIYTPEKWLRNIIFALTFSVGAYSMFTYGLNVFLPPGILG